jgi:hypothetical protein
MKRKDFLALLTLPVLSFFVKTKDHNNGFFPTTKKNGELIKKGDLFEVGTKPLPIRIAPGLLPQISGLLVYEYDGHKYYYDKELEESANRLWNATPL